MKIGTWGKVAIGVGLFLFARAAFAKKRPTEDRPSLPTGEEHSYVVQPGDSLSTIAKMAYGDEQLWPFLFDVNQEAVGSNPDMLSAGVTIQVPPASAIDPLKVDCYRRRYRRHLEYWQVERTSGMTMPREVVEAC